MFTKVFLESSWLNFPLQNLHVRCLLLCPSTLENDSLVIKKGVGGKFLFRHFFVSFTDSKLYILAFVDLAFAIHYSCTLSHLNLYLQLGSPDTRCTYLI